MELPTAKLKTPKGIVCVFALFFAALGNMILWVKYVPDYEGLLALLMIIVVFANCVAFLLDSPACSIVAAGFMYTGVAGNTCIADNYRDAKEGAYLAAYVLILMGAFASFVTFPVTWGMPAMSMEAISAVVLTAINTLGSIFLWASSDVGCGELWFVSLFVVVLYTVSKLFSFDRGVSLGFFLAAITIDDYQPFVDHRCSGLCEAGLTFCCLSLLGITCLQCFSEARRGGFDANKAKTPIGLVCCVGILLALTGCIIIWATKSTKGSEGFVAALLLLAAISNTLALASGEGSVLSLAACSLMLGGPAAGFARVVADVYSHQTNDEGIRLGYILLLVGVWGTFLALPVSVRAVEVTDATRTPLVIFLLLTAAAILGWPGSSVDAGFVGFIYLLASLFDWKDGVVRFAYFAALILTPSTMPLGQGAVTATVISFIGLVFILGLVFFEEESSSRSQEEKAVLPTTAPASSSPPADPTSYSSLLPAASSSPPPPAADPEEAPQAAPPATKDGYTPVA